MTRAEERARELDAVASVPDGVRPLLLVCPNCHETEPHTRFRCIAAGDEPWLLVCWGCDHMRLEAA
jgi:hypothetical protein